MLLSALLVMRPPRRPLRAWGVVAIVGLVYALGLNLQPANFPNSNFLHYYMGAKYPVPYNETYRVLLAGQDRPQVGMRDLRDPVHLERESVVEQRAYYLGLLRHAPAGFDPLASLDSLAARARDSGALAAEAESILAAHVPGPRREAFRRDAHVVAMASQGPRVTVDYGYNGSPFYGWLRQADPMLHRPLDPAAGVEQLLWQLLGVVLVAQLVGGALGYSPMERLAAATLCLVSMDFASFALPGLIFTEVWVPVAIAAWAAARRRWVLAGAAIAVAGLVKLFPVALLLAVGVPLVRSFLPASRGEDRAAPRRRALELGAGFVLTTVVFGALSSGSGRNWMEFAGKISVEFHSQLNMANNVSLAALLISGGVSDTSLLLVAAAGAAGLAVAAMFWGREDERFVDALPRRMLVLSLATGLLARSWLNYYVVIPFLLVPWVARRRPRAAAAILLAMAAVYALPPYEAPAVLGHPGLHVAKLLPFVAVPAWFVWREVRSLRGAGRLARVALAVLAVATGLEAWRQTTRLELQRSGVALLEAGDPRTALERFDRAQRLDPSDAWVRRKRAIALASLGRLEAALPEFARAAEQAPGDAAALADHARALFLAGRTGLAASQLERALALAPDDVQVLYVLAEVRVAQARSEEAMALLLRARELAPEEPAIPEAMTRLGGGSPDTR